MQADTLFSSLSLSLSARSKISSDCFNNVLWETQLRPNCLFASSETQYRYLETTLPHTALACTAESCTGVPTGAH